MSKYIPEVSVLRESVDKHGLLRTAITFAQDLDKMQFVVAKDDFLEMLNDETGSNYKRKHIDNYLAGRLEPTQKILTFCSYLIAKQYVDSDVAEIIQAALNKSRTQAYGEQP